MARIALHKDGRDPDFSSASKFDFDVEAILSMILLSIEETKLLCLIAGN